MTPDTPASAREFVAESGMVPDARRCKCEDNAQADFDPKGFDAVLAREYETIRARRNTFGITSSIGTEQQPDQRPADLFGIALSGGGIRSSSFCLGALQALDQYGLLCRADYLSTVSGGGYIAASMVAAMNAGAEDNTRERSPTGWAFPFTAGSNSDVSDTKLVGHIRDNGKFLAPPRAPRHRSVLRSADARPRCQSPDASGCSPAAGDDHHHREPDHRQAATQHFARFGNPVWAGYMEQAFLPE